MNIKPKTIQNTSDGAHVSEFVGWSFLTVKKRIVEMLCGQQDSSKGVCKFLEWKSHGNHLDGYPKNYSAYSKTFLV